MQSLPAPLCQFCQAAIARDGEAYCCDGCQTLDSVGASSSPADARPTAAPDLLADRRLTEHFGREQAGRVSFECHVDALTCEACLQGLAKLEARVPGLSELRWDRARSVLSFSFPREDARPALLGNLLDGMRLRPRWLRAGEQPAANRDGVLRLGLTGALAGNIMLFAVPVYTGVSGGLQSAFEWLQFLLFIPVALWSAVPIYRTAWVSLRLRQLNVDLPLALAFVLGSVFSTASLLSGGHDLYFDSLSGFLFLILWSRSLLERSLAKAIASPDLSHFFDKPLFAVERAGERLELPWDRLERDDRIFLSDGDRLPVDATLESEAVHVETAWMTGERSPRLRLRGSLLQAGVRLLSDRAVGLVLRPARDTEFAKLLQTLQSRGDKLGADLEGRLASGLVLTGFLVIAGMFLLAPHLGLGELLRRSIALLIVACPCAVSFAAPLARARANKIALKHGFWVRDPRVWDRLVGVSSIAFDKTGTLTGGLMRFGEGSPMIDPHLKRVILSLENISRHPVAESLRRLWGAHELLPVTDAREVPGVGVEGRIQGIFFEVKGEADSEGRVRIGLFRSGEKLVELFLQDESQPETKAALAKLGAGRELYLLSGDREERVRAFAAAHGFHNDHVYYDLDPLGKARVLELLQPEVFVGDGTNDLPSLKVAPVSVAVKAAAFEAQAAADLVMFDGHLGRLHEIFALAAATARLNRRNLAFALAYNLLAGTAAVAGWIHPLGAAVLMPISSLLLLASTTWGTRRLRELARSR